MNGGQKIADEELAEVLERFGMVERQSLHEFRVTIQRSWGEWLKRVSIPSISVELVDTGGIGSFLPKVSLYYSLGSKAKKISLGRAERTAKKIEKAVQQFLDQKKKSRSRNK